MMEIGQADADGRVPCARCGRKFAPDRIAAHQYICTQLKRGPAKPPDEVRERAEAIVSSSHNIAPPKPSSSSAAATRRPASNGRGRPAPPPQKSNWRAQSNQLQEAMRAARAARGAGGGGVVEVSDHRGGGGPAYRGKGFSCGPTVGRPSSSSSSGARPTMAQRKHAAEAHALEQARSPPKHGGNGRFRTQVDGSRIGGYPGMAAMQGGGSGGGLGSLGGGFDPTSNQTSRDNPFYNGR